jgi:cell wall-associated NlpC family hydrolase
LPIWKEPDMDKKNMGIKNMDLNKMKDSASATFTDSKKLLHTNLNRLFIEIIANINCFMHQLHHAIEGHHIRQKTISVMAPFLVLMLFMCYMFVTAPYGLTDDGKKVEEPFVIKAGAIELAVVESSSAAEQVMATFQNAFLAEGSEVVSFETEPFLNIAKKDMERAGGPVDVMSQPEAVNALLSACKGVNPLMSTTLTEQLVQSKSIAHKVVKKKTDKLTVGTKEVETKGVNGKKATVLLVTKVNGKVTASTEIKETVVKKPVTEVILIGTKPLPVATYSSAYSSPAISTSSKAVAGTTGADVVAYAKRFLGNPYQYGGTSLTNGTDCSGFTMSVYAHFGVYLPHSSYAQRSYGTPVSYSNAKPGDLMFYSGHVAIYIGGGKIIHASTERTGIIIGSATYRTILGVRRIL